MIYKSNVDSFNFKKIKEKGNELVEFDDYIPYSIRFTAFYPDLINDRIKYLKSNDLYEKIFDERQKRDLEYQSIKRESDKVNYLIEEVLEFVNSYPVYEMFINTKK